MHANIHTYVDAMAGSITRNGTVVLDFERTPIYLLNVSAEDSGVPSQVTVIPVVIEITVSQWCPCLHYDDVYVNVLHF